MTTTDLINIIGTIAFAISGYLVGYGKRLDVLGVVITALLTAIGGGMMRDALVGHIPQVFLRTDALIVVFATLAAAWLFRLERRRRSALTAAFIVADAIGLAAFSITGAQVGVALHLNLFGVVVLAFVTAVGGGIEKQTLPGGSYAVIRRTVTEPAQCAQYWQKLMTAVVDAKLEVDDRPCFEYYHSFKPQP